VAIPFICVAGIAAADPAAGTLKVGFGEADITPEIGMEQPGGYGKAYHRSIHDPCKVRAVVFERGMSRVALVGVDALLIRRPQVERTRRAIGEECGIPPEAILIAASHSHSSGPTGMILPGEFDHASPWVQSLAYEKSSCADPAYLELVEKRIVQAVKSANAHRVEALCGVGKGIEDRVAFNRRFLMKSGLTVTHPGRGNPEIVKVAGPTDPEVGVLGVWSKGGKFLGCLVNFACHATTSPGGISANYIYYLEQVIRGAMGQEAIVVFLPGASGDVTQVDNLSREASPGRERWAQIVGGRVGAEAVKVLLTMRRGSFSRLAGRSRILTIPRRRPHPDRLRQCREIAKNDPGEVGPTDWTFAKEIVLLDALIAREPSRKVEVQAIQVGPAVFLGNPSEYFCQYGLDLKARSPFPFTFPVTLANGCVGYVPTEEAFGEHGGGYETRLTSYSNLEISAGRKMAETAIELAEELEVETLPPPPPAPPFRAPWSYGNIPPERE